MKNPSSAATTSGGAAPRDRQGTPRVDRPAHDCQPSGSVICGDGKNIPGAEKCTCTCIAGISEGKQKITLCMETRMATLLPFHRRYVCDDTIIKTFNIGERLKVFYSGTFGSIERVKKAIASMTGEMLSGKSLLLCIKKELPKMFAKDRLTDDFRASLIIVETTESGEFEMGTISVNKKMVTYLEPFIVDKYSFSIVGCYARRGAEEISANLRKKTNVKEVLILLQKNVFKANSQCGGYVLTLTGENGRWGDVVVSDDFTLEDSKLRTIHSGNAYTLLPRVRMTGAVKTYVRDRDFLADPLSNSPNKGNTEGEPASKKRRETIAGNQSKSIVVHTTGHTGQAGGLSD